MRAELVCPQCGASGSTAKCPDDGVLRVNVPAGSADWFGKVLGGKYRLLAGIGDGTFGRVYRAWHLTLQCVVAVKVLRSTHGTEARRRFHEEARLCAKLRHPHIVSVFDFGETDAGEPYLAMELMDGATLESVLERLGPLPAQRAAAICSQVLQALGAAHRAGVIHRDLKPDNVFLAQVGDLRDHVKVLDFGIAKLTEAEGSRTPAGTVFGTPQYMSPEQCRGLPVDARSDLYSLGVMLYRCLAGRLPFETKGALQLLLSHVSEAPFPLRQALPSIDPELDRLVTRLLGKRPEDRPASAAAVHRQLEDWLHARDHAVSNGMTLPLTTNQPRARTAERSEAAGRLETAEIARHVLAEDLPPPLPTAPTPLPIQNAATLAGHDLSDLGSRVAASNIPVARPTPARTWAVRLAVALSASGAVVVGYLSSQRTIEAKAPDRAIAHTVADAPAAAPARRPLTADLRTQEPDLPATQTAVDHDQAPSEVREEPAPSLATTRARRRPRGAAPLHPIKHNVSTGESSESSGRCGGLPDRGARCACLFSDPTAVCHCKYGANAAECN